jgi:regulator of replication initiation timing
MNDNDVIYTTTFTIGDLREMVQDMVEDDEVHFSGLDLSNLRLRLEDVVMAVIQDFIDDLDS